MMAGGGASRVARVAASLCGAALLALSMSPAAAVMALEKSKASDGPNAAVAVEKAAEKIIETVESFTYGGRFGLIPITVRE